MRVFYKNNQMRITDITINTKIKNLFTMTVESKTKTTLKLTTIGHHQSQVNCESSVDVMSLVVVLIGRRSRDVIGRLSV